MGGIGFILIGFGMFSFIETILYWINSNQCHLSGREGWFYSDRFWHVFHYTDYPILGKLQTMPFKQ